MDDGPPCGGVGPSFCFISEYLRGAVAMSDDNGKGITDCPKWLKDREYIVDLYKGGMDGVQISKKEGMPIATVYFVLRAFGVLRGKPARDRIIAATRIANGEEPAEVAAYFNRSISWIKAACAEQRVTCHFSTMKPETKSKVLETIARLQNDPNEDRRSIGSSVGLSRERVRQVVLGAKHTSANTFKTGLAGKLFDK